MASDRPGALGRLLAGRPALMTLLLSAGLTVLAVISVREAINAGPNADAVIRLMVAFLAMPVAPLAIAAAAPRTLASRLAVACAVVLLALLVWVAPPILAPSWPQIDGRFIAAWGLVTAGLVLLAPSIGASMRYCFVGSAGSVVAVAGAAAFLGRAELDLQSVAALASFAIIVGAAIGVGASADFTAFFARGGDPRTAAAAAGQQAIAPILLASVLALGVFAAARFSQPSDAGAAADLRYAGLAAATAFVAATASAVAGVGALALSRPREIIAVAENTRRQNQRRFWRKFRNLLAPSTAYSVVAVATLLLVALSIDSPRAPGLAHLGILTAVGFAAALTLVSVRSGVFTIAAVAAAAIGAELLAGLFGAPPIGIGAAALLFAILGVHFALLALAWRDARSPRFNPRETTEAAATEGVGRFAVCVVASVGTLYAADVTGFWPEADAVALRLIIGSIIGVLLAPALMTALSAATGRESA